jgi:hypothetical protein
LIKKKKIVANVHVIVNNVKDMRPMNPLKERKLNVLDA